MEGNQIIIANRNHNLAFSSLSDCTLPTKYTLRDSLTHSCKNYQISRRGENYEVVFFLGGVVAVLFGNGFSVCVFLGYKICLFWLG